MMIFMFRSENQMMFVIAVLTLLFIVGMVWLTTSIK